MSGRLFTTLPLLCMFILTTGCQVTRSPNVQGLSPDRRHVIVENAVPAESAFKPPVEQPVELPRDSDLEDRLPDILPPDVNLLHHEHALLTVNLKLENVAVTPEAGAVVSWFLRTGVEDEVIKWEDTQLLEASPLGWVVGS